MKPKTTRVTRPRIRLIDPRFQYVPAEDTDLGKTFARERARLEQSK